ncbi:MAG TPA: tail fiber protein [Xanthomonadales bacterium]|nr:tail fiber protein [Xanthomonadales bacterium]
MGTPYIGEIKIVSFNFAPQGWAQCNGQFLPINQNQALFSLLGTTYGGNGQTTFALPDFRERIPIHMGAGRTMGERAGENAHTVTVSEMPAHVHALNGSTADADQPVIASGLPGTANNLYALPANFTALSPASIGNSGGSQPHENRQPYSVLLFCIALQGVFPSQN